jgi:hypothetical protein
MIPSKLVTAHHQKIGNLDAKVCGIGRRLVS